MFTGAALNELLDFLAVVVIHPPATRAAGVVAMLALNHYTDANATVVVHCRVTFLSGQAAHLKDNRGRLVVQERNLRVGRLSIIVVSEPPPDAHHPRGQLCLAKRPATHVHLVNSLVAHIAVAGRPYPVPIVMQALAHQRHQWCRTGPQVIVH